MPTDWILIELSATIVQAYLIVMFTHDFLGGKLNVKKDRVVKLWMWLLFSASIVVCNLITYFEGIAIVIFALLLFIYSALFLTGSWLVKMIASVVPILCTVLSSSFTFHFIAMAFAQYPYDILTEPGLARLFALIMAQLLLFYLLFSILKVSKKGKVLFTKSESLLIIFIFLISMVLFFMIDLVALNNELPRSALILLLICIAGLVIINIIIMYLVYRVSEKNAIATQYQLLQQRLAHQEQYSEIAKQQYQSIAQIRHDLKHNFSVLSLLMAQKEYKKADKLISGLMDTQILILSPIQTKNETLNAILSVKLSYARSLGIKTFCVVPEEFTLLNDLEICSLFGNLLDNAIEYCEKHLDAENEISVTIGLHHSQCTILVTNSLQASVLDTNADLRTAKSDKGRHGIGIKSVGQIVSMHDGLLDFYEQNEMFCARVVLFIGEK